MATVSRVANGSQNVSVVGVNDTADSQGLNPRLTTVRVFTYQLGKQMAEMVLKLIAQPGSGRETVTIPTQLVKRESCGGITAADESGEHKTILKA